MQEWTYAGCHDPALDFTLLELDRAEIRLRVPARATHVDIVYWNKYRHQTLGRHEKAMTAWSTTANGSYYRVTLQADESRIRYLQYVFRFVLDGQTYWVLSHGVGTELRPQHAFQFSYAGDRDAVHSPGWIRDRIWYQIFPERFHNGDSRNDPKGVEVWGSEPTRDNFMGGDLRGIINKLDAIEALGVNALYLNPIFVSRSNHKYDTEDYMAIDPAFGTKEDLKELVAKCHDRDIKVVLDLVINHCGYFHPFFQDVIARGANSPYKEWFYIQEYPIELSEDRYDSVGYWKYMPKLRTSTPQVRQYIYDLVTFWQEETGIDGWRIDVADEVEFSFLRELNAHVKRVTPDAFIIAEIWYDAKPLMVAKGADSFMNYELRAILLELIADQTIQIEEFHERLTRHYHRYSLKESMQQFNLLGSHDTERVLTRCKQDENALKTLTAMQFMLPGTPVVYYGDEIGMTGENDPGCRGAMDWSMSRENNELWRHLRSWTNLRRSAAGLIHGDLELAIDTTNASIMVQRTSDEETLYLIVNLSDAGRAQEETLIGFGLAPERLEFVTSSEGQADRLGDRQYALYREARK
ncbi:MAG: glycoside hydrolase family 13 protein [Cohnella sp.]|nr:glycoside hydrolase family 13 protein [Cohnella sp.]